ncbi:MAG: lysylphosphatidylglycerol synthase transmembrane domain-containing protein [Candidatus Omnitrophota bacterium]
MIKKESFFIIRILVSLALIMLLLWLARDNFTKILRALSSVNIYVFAAAFFIFLLSIVFLSWRLKVILFAQNCLVSFRDLFSLTMIAYFFTNFMPTSVGGDLIKGYYIAKKIKAKLNSYASVIMDRVIGMFSLLFLSSSALFFMGRDSQHDFIVWADIILFLGCTVVMVILIHRGLAKKIISGLGISRLLQRFKFDAAVKKMYMAISVYQNQKGRLLQMFFISLIAQLVSFVTVYLLAESFSVHVPIEKVVLAMPLIAVLCMLPITMNGLGLREWGFIFFFSPGIGNTAAFSLSLLYLGVSLLTSIVGGVIYLFWR